VEGGVLVWTSQARFCEFLGSALSYGAKNICGAQYDTIVSVINRKKIHHRMATGVDSEQLFFLLAKFTVETGVCMKNITLSSAPQ